MSLYQVFVHRARRKYKSFEGRYLYLLALSIILYLIPIINILWFSFLAYNLLEWPKGWRKEYYK